MEKKIRSPTRATLTNANFQSFFLCIRNKIELSRRPTFKNPNFESKNELKNTIPHEKINRCLTDINKCLNDIFKI